MLSLGERMLSERFLETFRRTGNMKLLDVAGGK
jgi:hypothetical protein